MAMDAIPHTQFVLASAFPRTVSGDGVTSFEHEIGRKEIRGGYDAVEIAYRKSRNRHPKVMCCCKV